MACMNMHSSSYMHCNSDAWTVSKFDNGGSLEPLRPDTCMHGGRGISQKKDKNPEKARETMMKKWMDDSSYHPRPITLPKNLSENT